MLTCFGVLIQSVMPQLKEKAMREKSFAKSARRVVALSARSLGTVIIFVRVLRLLISGLTSAGMM